MNSSSHDGPVGTDVRRLLLASALLAAVLLAPLAPTNAPFTVANDVQWLPSADGIEFGGRGGVRSPAPPERLYTDVIDAGELSIELVLTPTVLDQHGPARIVSMSQDVRHRNLTIGQELDELAIRVRTTETNLNASEPSISVPGVFAGTEQRHIVVTTDLGETRVYLDGRLAHRGPGPGGDLHNWDLDYPLLLGNEATGDRPWAGRLFRVAFYDRVLDPGAVEQLYDLHAHGQTPPSGERTSPASARYDFTEGAGWSIEDHGDPGLGGRLMIPQRFRSGPAGPTWTVGEVSPLEWLGVSLHVIAVLGWLAAALAVVHRRAGRSTVRRLLVGLLVVVGAIAVLTGMMWPRDDTPDDPDAVVVLGAAGLERAQLGIELVTRHDAQLVLSASAVEAGEQFGFTCGDEAICVDPAPVTTAGEARAVADLARERGWDRVTIATSRFHTTRSRVLFRQCLGDQVSVVGTARPDGRSLGVHLNETIGTLAALTIRRAC